MTPKRFYRLSLILPVVIPLALLPFEPSAFSVILWSALGFGGPAYLPFAALLFFWLGRLRTLGQTQLLSFCAPLIFLPFLAASGLIFAAVQAPTVGTAVSSDVWKGVGVFSLFALLVGYVYVAVANALALLLEGLGLLQARNPNQRLEPTG